MTSLIRSAAWSVFCSRCCRCRRTFRYPSSAKITSIAPSNSRFSLALRLCVSRNQRPRFGSVAAMLHHRPHCNRRTLTYLFHREFLLGKNGQILHCQSKRGKTDADDHSSYRQLAPLGEVPHPRGPFESRDADVHSVGYEAKHNQHGGNVESVRTAPNSALHEQDERKNDRQQDLKPEQVGFVSGMKRQLQRPTICKIFEA